MPINHLSSRLPRRFPVGAKYVVEGSGGEEGNLRVIASYVVLPGGRRINVPADLSQPASPRARAFRRGLNPKRSTAEESQQLTDDALAQALWFVRRSAAIANMITLEDCIGLCGLTEEEVLAIAEHEHLPEIAATALAQYLLS